MTHLFRKVISASLSPNTQLDDVMAAVRMFFSPWQWRRGSATGKTEKWFEKNFPGFHAVSFNSGRSALFAILRAFGIGKGDEVLVGAFTCVAVPNSVLWAGAKPVYVDIDSSLNVDIGDAQKKITSKTKAIIVQHTLGNPAALDEVRDFTIKHNILLIEDCAHSLGALYEGKKIGTFAHASFFSFGRDKVLSSVFGGMAIVSNARPREWKYLLGLHRGLAYPSIFWIFQQLLHPIAFWFILPVYSLGVGKVLLVSLQRLGVLSFPVYKEEKKGGRPQAFPAKYPNALAYLLTRQLSKLQRYNQNRQTIALQYQVAIRADDSLPSLHFRDGGIFLRFPLLVPDPKTFMLRAKKKGILLGNWYHHIIDPVGVDYRAVGYKKGSCPVAEKIASHIINLPTRISTAEAQRIVDLLS